VYNDTKSQHLEKAKLDEMIEDINREIEELMRVLDRKKKEKEMLFLEKQVHEHKIDQARMKYSDQISEHEQARKSLASKIAKNTNELSQWQQDKQDLEEYEDHFNAQITKFKEEFKSLDEMEHYLRFNSVEIDQCNKERKEIRTKHNEILNQMQTLNLEKQQIERGKEFIQERLQKLESELDDFET
jgi:chromosome segregation ATPase